MDNDSKIYKLASKLDKLNKWKVVKIYRLGYLICTEYSVIIEKERHRIIKNQINTRKLS